MKGKWWTLATIMIGMFMLFAGHHDRHDVALPNIQKQFHVSLSDLQWVIDAYALTLAAGLLTTGAFADLWGRKGQLVSPGPASVNHS